MDVDKQVKDNNKRTVMDIGAMLVEARENKNLSAEDIAEQLNLTLSVITNIEANQFKQDIPLAFIRGYLRSYAQKVGADVETLSVEFDRQTQVEEEPIQKIQVVSNFKSSRKEINSSSFVFKLITYLIVISILAFAGWEVWKRYGAPELNSDNSANEIQLEPLTLETEQSDNSDLVSQTSQSDDLPSAPASEIPLETISDADKPVESSEPAAQVLLESKDDKPVVNEEVKELVIETVETSVSSSSDSFITATFTFSDKCWVNITDANGEVLATGVKVAGKVMPLEGIAPFSVVLGNPAVVELTLNGESYDLSNFRAGRTAKFNLQSPQE